MLLLSYSTFNKAQMLTKTTIRHQEGYAAFPHLPHILSAEVQAAIAPIQHRDTMHASFQLNAARNHALASYSKVREGITLPLPKTLTLLILPYKSW